jgi:hypothetical protein
VSGNDGSWFLEVVGAIPATPTPSETVAALELDNTEPILDPVRSVDDDSDASEEFNGGTGTSTSAFEAPTAVLTVDADDARDVESVPRAPRAEVTDDAQLSAVLRTRRPFRWPVLGSVVFVVALAAVAAFWLPASLRQNVAGVKASYADASVALRLELPSGQAALDVITDPSSTQEELSASVPVITQLDSSAHELSVIAAEPLPRQIPFVGSDELESLGTFQDAAQINAAQGSDIARRLGHTYVYRTTIPQLLDTGDLPTTADVQTINALSVSLASSLVEDSTALSDLPTTEFAADINDAAHVAIERYASWQDEYLEALAEGDETVAAELIAELDQIRSGLDAALIAALGVARIAVDQQIVELAASLESFLVDLTP